MKEPETGVRNPENHNKQYQNSQAKFFVIYFK